MKNIKPSRSFSDTLLNQTRQEGDKLADDVINLVYFKMGIKGLREFFKWTGQTIDNTFETEPELTEKLQDFFAKTSKIPSFLDPEKIKKGLTFAQKNQEQIGLMLGCLSLPYCYAGANGAKVLWMSERIKNDTRKRLEETGEFVFGVMNPKEWNNDFMGSKNLILRIQKIRLMHACIRFFTTHYGTWNAAEWGKPVNQEDMAGTNLAFSYVVIKGMRTNGKTLTDEETEAYLHLWAVIGFWSGVSEKIIPQNLREAFLLDKAIARRQFKASEEGIGLTKALIKTLEEFVPNDNPIIKSIPTAFMRFLLGDTIADLLEVPQLRLEKQFIRMIPTDLIFKNNDNRITK
jgi:ER-bound oxygenase mpaB/B'/Rubber oxygenase, catalytic domain